MKMHVFNNTLDFSGFVHNKNVCPQISSPPSHKNLENKGTISSKMFSVLEDNGCMV